MRDHERAMLAYACLADVSQQRGQYPGRDRFLLLTAAAACRAGWPDVANRCQVLVLAHNPAHLVGRFELFTDALRSGEFAPFLKQLERFCNYEKAEHLLNELEIEPEELLADSGVTAGEFVLRIFSEGPWREES